MLRQGQGTPWKSNANEGAVDLYKLVRQGGKTVALRKDTVSKQDQYKVMAEKGLFRLAVHCWCIGEWNNGSIILQQRSMSDYRYPGLLDISASGIVDAGELLRQGALREIGEELRLLVEERHLIKSGMGIESKVTKEEASGLMPGQIPNLTLNELVGIYFIKVDDLPVQRSGTDGEVMGLYSVSIGDGIKLFSRQGGRIPFAFKLDVGTGFYRPTTEGLSDVSIGHIVPRHMKHYLSVFKRAEEILKKDPLAG